MTVYGPEQPTIGNGDLTYSMVVDVGEPGGNTFIRMTPNHGFSDISPS